MTATSQAVDGKSDANIPAAEALRAFPEELRRLAVVSREVEDIAGRLAEAAVDTDAMNLQHLDMLTQYLEGMATFVECLLTQADLTDTVSQASLVETVKPYDLLQRLVKLSMPEAPIADADVDLF